MLSNGFQRSAQGQPLNILASSAMDRVCEDNGLFSLRTDWPSHCRTLRGAEEAMQIMRARSLAFGSLQKPFPGMLIDPMMPYNAQAYIGWEAELWSRGQNPYNLPAMMPEVRTTSGGKWPASEDVLGTASKKKNSSKKDLSQCPPIGDGPITTLMVRNIPCCITQQQLADIIDEMGYDRKYDLLFVPPDGRPTAAGRSNLGYGFVNFISVADAESFAQDFEGYRFKGTASIKVGTTKPAHVQGFENTLQHFRGMKKGSRATFICRL